METKKNIITSILNKYPSYRDDIIQGCWHWLAGRRVDDGAEGLWRVNDKLYDVTDFVERHPGGKEWLQLSKGTDITEAFISTHIFPKAQEVLKKYYVREAKQPRIYRVTFEENGFYETLRRKVIAKFKNDLVDKSVQKWSKIYFDMVLFLTLASAGSIMWMGPVTIWLMMILTGLLVEWVNLMAHNFVHQKNNWRMRMSFLALMSWRDWRVFHVMSHHPYPNSNSDFEITPYNPYFHFMPIKQSKASVVMSYIRYFYVIPFAAFSSLHTRIMGLFLSETKVFYYDELLQLVIPTIMFFSNPYPYSLLLLKNTILCWMFVMLITGACHNILALTAGHHGMEITHESDEIKSLDFGLYQMSTTIDRKAANSNLFMSLTHFGNHTVHHLFPTLDTAIVPQFYDVFFETCKEFEAEFRKISMWEAVVQCFKQVGRTETIKYE